MCLNLKLSGNEVFYTASSLLVIFRKSYSELHCQQVFKLKNIAYEISVWERGGPHKALRGGIPFPFVEPFSSFPHENGRLNTLERALRG